MITQRKRLIICFRVLYAAASFNRQLWAMGLSFSSAASAIGSKDAMDLDVMVSGLQSDAQRHSFRNLAAFRFRLRYDHTALNFCSYMLRKVRNIGKRLATWC